MARLKLKQSDIKNQVKIGAAKDISAVDPKTIKETLSVIGVSKGVYGMNGALLQGYKTKKFYAITSRCSNLFYWVS